MQELRNGRRQALAAATIALFLVAASQAKALSRPTLAAPSDAATVSALPVFAWKPVTGAAKYEIQVSSDPDFSSIADYGDFFTKNTRATLKRSMPNGPVYWRVRASNANGAVSAWSSTRSVLKNWNQAPTPLYPTDGAMLSYPANALRLTWSAVPRTYKYSVTLASDGLLATPLNGFPLETSATSLTYHPSDLVPDPDKTYYWSVTPIDARGNAGTPSATSSFHWDWPTAMTPALSDLVAADELFDPKFSWGLVPGAAKYEVEVNSDSGFAGGSRVLDEPTIVGSSFAPRGLLPNNTYYWRVRAIDADGNTGVWNEGTPFQKSFADETVLGRPSVTNLHMFYADEDSGTSGYQTTKPLVVWDAVPGASSYDVEAGVWNGSACVFDNPLASVTATTAWTPLGKRGVGISPYSTAGFANPLDDGIKALTPGAQYCVRVRPRDRSAGSPTGDLNPIVIGTWTYLNSGGFSFDWTGYATGGGCSPSCTTGYLGANDYLAPVKGSTMGDMPVFRWNPVSGAVSYFVVVARDSGFTNVVDYVFTRVPAYAPRKNQGASESRTYPDETTKYYWAVLPSPNLDGSSAAFNPLSAAPSDFLKRTAAPSLLSPADGQKVGTWPTFQWTPVAGARVYEIQVDDASTFASPVDTKKTNSTAYTSEATYAADKLLYWRVRPLDDNLTPLTWSVPRTFQRKLPAPAWDSGLPTSGATTPTFTWTPITGAVSYDLDTDSPDGKHKQWNDLRSAALTYVYFYGTGVFGQRVRANFPATSGSTHGPWSTTLKFTKLLPPPANPTQSVSAAGVSFSWSPRAEAREYKVQVSRTPDFAQPVETATTDNTSFAPLLTMYGYLAGGRFYWRVAAVDEGRNVGRYSAAKSFSRPKGMRLSSFGTPTRGKRVTITFTVRRYGAGSDPVARARVRIWGVGISATSKLTRSDGRVTFSVRARRNGTLWAKATKSGFSAVQIGVKTR